MIQAINEKFENVEWEAIVQSPEADIKMTFTNNINLTMPQLIYVLTALKTEFGPKMYRIKSVSAGSNFVHVKMLNVAA